MAEHMKRLGFIMDDLAYSQAPFFLINWSNIATMTDLAEVSIFQDSKKPACMECEFGHMSVQEAFSYDGPLICNNIKMAAKLIHCIGNKSKYFYVWDLEWLRIPHQHKNYHELASIYRHPKLQLLARSEEHKRVIEDHWNVQVAGIIDNYNFNDLIRVIYANN